MAFSGQKLFEAEVVFGRMIGLQMCIPDRNATVRIGRGQR
jgi:hypothetical protein